MLTEDKIIGITSRHYEDSRRVVSDSELITTAIISSLHFGGHQDKARQFTKMTGLVPEMLDKSRFNRTSCIGRIDLQFIHADRLLF